MTTAAQFEANRQNAQASTGPRTEAGKARSSQNATKLGLFSTRNCVLPKDREEYNELSQALWDRLNPHDSLEGAFAIEVIRATWRLRRCACVEADLGDHASSQEQEHVDKQAPRLPVHDVMMNPSSAPVQTAVDRARAQALSSLRRSLAELRRLQTERQLRNETIPAQIEPATLGVSDSKQVSEGIIANARFHLAVGKVEKIASENALDTLINSALIDTPLLGDWNGESKPETKGSQTPRNAQCPCGSGQKFKRCCGVEAPAVLHHTAAA